MKKGMLLLLLVSSVFANAQSLKEALFSGKLKTQSGGVIRKGADLTSKIDTTQQVATTETVKSEPALPAVDSATTNVPAQTDAADISATDTKVESTGAVVTGTAAAAATTAPEAAAPKSNNVLWKEYMDSVANTLKTEALSSKKVKRGSYYVLVSYTIDTDGQVTVGDVFLSPENDYLQQQIKDRLASDTPRLSPVLNSVGTPRKVTKKYNFTLTKE